MATSAGASSIRIWSMLMAESSSAPFLVAAPAAGMDRRGTCLDAQAVNKNQ
jgi:hypothetical protein